MSRIEPYHAVGTRVFILLSIFNSFLFNRVVAHTHSCSVWDRVQDNIRVTFYQTAADKMTHEWQVSKGPWITG